MTTSDVKTLRQKMIQILTANPQQIALLQLFELEAESDEQQKIQIRQTIMLVLENHHDWDKISKCLKFWKGLDKYIRSFYKRMKQRLNEVCDMNISISDMQSQFQRMFDKHKLVAKSKAEPINANIDKYLTKDYKKVVIDQNTPDFVETKKQEPKNDVPNIKKDPLDKIPQQPAEKAQLSQKSNSLSSKNSNFNNVRAIEKKPTFGMLRRQDSNSSNSNSNSNLVSRRNTSRRTFGQGTDLKSVQVIKPLNQSVEEKQQLKNTEIEPQKVQELKSKQFFKPFNQPQKQQKQEIKNKPEQPRKLNIFQRKQHTIINRPNNLLATQRKQQTQNINQQSKQKRIDSSFSKSVTPQKPLVHRKKIILKKPSDFEQNFFDSDDEFSSFKKLESYENSSDTIFYSQQKDSFPMNRQEEQLRMEIQNQCSKQLFYDQNKKNPQIEMKMAQKTKEPIFNQEKSQYLQKQKSILSKPKPPSFKKSSIQISMVRQPDQLFSDHEVSLMGFNPRGYQCGVNYYKLVDKCKTWSWKIESNKWDEKIKNLKNKNKKVQTK